jgi:hypothetical protein
MIKELEDLEGFPMLLRQFQADFIGSMTTWLRLYRPLIPLLQPMVDRLPRITDLCTGSGLPAIQMHRQLRGISLTLLTDKFPRPVEVGNGIQTWDASLDVLTFQTEPNCIYTMYNAFHHFTPQQQVQLLQKMAAGRVPFLFTEILSPGIFDLIKIIVVTTFGQLLTTPFIRPFRWDRLLFTYLLPVNLFTVLYDGVVSVFRAHPLSHYHKLTAIVPATDYEISVQRKIRWTGPLIIIKGEVRK